jgi:hypothetical protein
MICFVKNYVIIAVPNFYNMNQIFTLGAGGLEPVAPINLEVNNVVFFNGYGHSRQPWVIIKVLESGRSYKAVSFDDETPVVRHVDFIRKEKFGIGFYLGTKADFEAWELTNGVDVALVQKRVEEAEANEAKRRQEEKEKAEIQAKNEQLGREWLKANRPDGAKRAIIASLRQDESDMQTDYFNYSTKKTILLGWSFKEREDFNEMRNAIESCTLQDVKYILEDKAGYEHRENYTGGSGYYLGKSKYSGWVVKKASVDIEGWCWNPENIALGESKAVQSGVESNGLGIGYRKSKYNAKTGNTFFVAVPAERLGRDDYESEKSRAEASGGFYLKFAKGFAWKTEAARDAFISISEAADEQGGGYAQAHEDFQTDQWAQNNL